MSTSSAQTTTNDWRTIVARYQGSDYVRSMTQIANTLGTTRRILELRMKAYSIREDF